MPDLKDLKSHKSCTKCRKVKHVREYRVDGRKSDHLQSWCRQCESEYQFARVGRYSPKWTWIPKNQKNPSNANLKRMRGILVGVDGAIYCIYCSF